MNSLDASHNKISFSMVHRDFYNIDNVIRFTLKVPSIRIFLSIGSLYGKNFLSEGHPRFLSNFPFVNLQIDSIVESLRSIKYCTQYMKKRIRFSQRYAFWGIQSFLARLSRRLIGELIVYTDIRHPSVRRLSSARPSIFSNDVSSEAVRTILSILHI